MALRFVYGLVAAAVIGFGLAWLAGRLRDLTGDTAARAAVSLVLPFAVYLAADAVAASGVVAVVVAGLTAVSHQDADDTAGRLTTSALWAVVEVVATGLAFALVGAELRTVLAAAGTGLPRMLAHAGVVCAVVVGLRGAWMAGAVLGVRRRRRADDAAPRDWREAAVMTWGGMRGLATLALALALPTTVAGGAPFPGRTEAVVIAATVLVVTLLLPGFTLPALVRALGVSEDEQARQGAEAEVLRRAREAARAVLLDPEVLRDDGGDGGEELQARVERMAALHEMLGDTEPTPDRAEHLAELRRRRQRRDRVESAALAAARSAVVAARDERGIDPEAVDRVLRRLDVRGRPG